MMRIRPLALALSASLITACAPTVGTPSGVASGGPAGVSPRQPTLDIKQFTLKNGLKVAIVEQHHAPVVTLNITYNVGSRDERPGRTGFAHLFEHMMFQGSENVGKAEHFMLINDYGGSMNGSTSFDRTNYFQTVPANQLEMVLFLEADRMRSLDISQENLDNQRNAVQEERRLRYDNRPYGTTIERVMNLAYDNFAYKHSTIGSMSDLNAATRDDVASFFKAYYAPNNAWLVLIGDIKAETALPLIEKHFGAIPAVTLQPIPDLAEKKDKGERRQEYTDPMAPLPQLTMAMPTVPGNHPDYFALDMLSTILGGGESSRLYQSLVKEQQLATNAWAGVMGIRGDGPLFVQANAAPGKTPQELELALNAQLDRIMKEPVSEAELKRALTGLRAQLVGELETSMYLSMRMGEHSVYFNDPTWINQMPGKYAQVTVADIQRVANTYLKPTNRAILTILAGKAAPGAQAQPPAGK